MSRTPNTREVASVKDILSRMSEKTGFINKNCRIAYTALNEIFQEIMLEGKTICFPGFGRLEPRQYPPRKFKKMTKDGIAKDELGREVFVKIPARTEVKFFAVNSFRYKLNPGVYAGEFSQAGKNKENKE